MTDLLHSTIHFMFFKQLVIFDATETQRRIAQGSIPIGKASLADLLEGLITCITF